MVRLPVLILPRLSKAAGLQQSDSAIASDPLVIRCTRQRLPIGVERGVEPALHLQHHPEIGPRFGRCGVGANRRLEPLRRLGKPSGFRQRQAHLAMQLRIARIRR
jgi:hypothetical protein